ncbi:hypothetical protein L9F63_013431, partial [Diploptera punctata]
RGTGQPNIECLRQITHPSFVSWYHTHSLSPSVVPAHSTVIPLPHPHASPFRSICCSPSLSVGNREDISPADYLPELASTSHSLRSTSRPHSRS